MLKTVVFTSEYVTKRGESKETHCKLEMGKYTYSRIVIVWMLGYSLYEIEPTLVKDGNNFISTFFQSFSALTEDDKFNSNIDGLMSSTQTHIFFLSQKSRTINIFNSRVFFFSNQKIHSHQQTI